MAYKPSLKDIPQTQEFYSPSLEDIPQPQAKTQTPLPQYRFKPPNMFLPTNEEAQRQEQKRAEEAQQGFSGALKSFGNTPTELMNIFRKQAQPVPFPYQNPTEQKGAMAGDILSFFAPGAGIGAVTKGMTYIPKVGKGVNALLKGIEESSFIKNLLNIGRTGMETSIMEARKNPEQSLGQNALVGAQGSALQTLLNATLSRNPIVNNLAKSLLGASAGYVGGNALGISPYKSVPAGIAGIFGGHQLLKELGIMGGPVSEEFLSHINNPSLNNYKSDLQQRLAANKRLGTAIRPSEASNNTYLGKVEGNIAGSSAGSQELAQQEAIRTKDQQSAINRLLNTIHSKTPEAQNAIRQAYKNANRWNMNEEFMNTINNDPIVQEAQKRVRSSAALRKDLEGVAPNNVMYLDKVKQAMDDMQSAALRAGNKNEARIIGETKNEFATQIDNSVPEYARARQLAQRSIVRSQIEKLMRKKEINGFQFYNTVLKNNDEYKKLYDSLKNVPEAQAILKDMKQGWDTIISPKTARGAIHLSETSMDKARSGVQGLLNHFKDLIGAKRDVQRAKFIYSKDWAKEFEALQKLKNETDKRNAMIKLIAKSLGAEKIAED